MSDDDTVSILELAGRDPLPWLHLLHPSSAADGEKADPRGAAAARDDVEDQGLQRDQQDQEGGCDQQMALPCAPSAILEAWPGFSGDGIPPSLAGEPGGVAACLALAAQCRDDEAARCSVWSRPESLKSVLAMLKVRGALGESCWVCTMSRADCWGLAGSTAT